jgi:F0F1-type ATP synthase membrane subunit c/vacuolar-type H+-ATPase subunit K
MNKKYGVLNMKYLGAIILALIPLYSILHTPYPTFAQGYNVASTYKIDSEKAVSGDIIISNGEKGLTLTNVAYDSRIFGVLDDDPRLVLRTPDASLKPVVREGDVLVNITDYNDLIKKGDYVTSSPVEGKGMKAKQSGYVLGIALDDAKLSEQTVTIDGRQVKSGTVLVAMKIEYAELSTARNSIRLLDNLNAAFFRNVQDPERFTNTLRYLLAGIIAILAFGIGFFWVGRSISKAVEAIGRNPLAKQSIYLSVIFQIGLTVIGAIVTIIIVFILIKF